VMAGCDCELAGFGWSAPHFECPMREAVGLTGCRVGGIVASEASE
jgi:hypothetical protein